MKLAVRTLPDGTGYVGVFKMTDSLSTDDLVVTGSTVVECLKELTKAFEARNKTI